MEKPIEGFVAQTGVWASQDESEFYNDNRTSELFIVIIIIKASAQQEFL